MSQGPVPFRAETLIEHHDFVIGLARSLVRDPHEAADVAQETWLSALTHSPSDGSGSALRAWLGRVTRSRASDRSRDEVRRAYRERAAARTELDDSASELRDRVALAHEVVEAVLDLPDPARSVILLHYYEGLSAAEIARKKSVPSGTVRAQISRALDLLRERLDARHGGRRDAWSVALTAIAARGGKSLLGSKVGIAAAVVVAVVAIPIAISTVLSPAGDRPLETGKLLAASTPHTPVTGEPSRELAVPLDARASGAVDATDASEAGSTPIEPAADRRASAANAPGVAVVNGDFESPTTKDGGIPGWDVAVGARNGAEEPLASVKIDTKEKHKGRASLFLFGDDTTRAWKAARHDLAVQPGGTYHLTAWARVEKVRQETVRGTSIRQFANCFVGLFLMDANGEMVARDFKTPNLPTSGWQKLSIDLAAPDTVREAFVSVSLTMSGSLWVDDLELTIDGGKELPAPEMLVHEDFEKATKVPSGWEESVGAHNGEGGSRSTIAIDKSAGAAGSHASLHFAGNRSTIQWYFLDHKFDAAPGDAFTFRARAKGKDVRKEGIQFENLHIGISFLDADGKSVGTPKFAHPGEGTFEWKDLVVKSVAPEGTAKAQAGIFLSMSGDAWFDDVVVTKQGGSRPAYADWLSLETPHLIVRYSKDNPRAGGIKAYADKLDQAFEHIVQSLGVEYADKITMYIYRDAQQGKNLTGRELDFSNPEGKTVHQSPNSTLGHEMAHCVALKLGYSQTGLLGEGLAVYLNGDTPEWHHKQAAQLLAKGELPAISGLLTDFGNQKNSYPAAGSFCGYVIETFGMDKFKQLYPTSDPASQAPSTLGKSLEEIDKDWREFLKTRG